MFPVYAYGHDYGNAETCGVLFDTMRQQHSLVIPSATALGDVEDLARKRSALGDSYERPTDALTNGEYVLGFRGSETFVGSLALNQARSASTARGDVHRYWSQKSLEMLLVVSGRLVPHPEYELDVVTGLPIETFSSENRRRVRAALEGDHVFTLNGKRRRSVLRVAKVIMEGAGATIAYGSSAPVPQATIDIGGRTTDIFVSVGQNPQFESCKGKPLGVEAAADLLNARFQARYKRPLSGREIRGLLRAHIQRYAYPSLFTDQGQVPEELLRTWVEAALREIGREIASFVSITLNVSEGGSIGSDLAAILLVGGGAYYFEQDLRERIPRLQVPDCPESANAVGYARLALVGQSAAQANTVRSA